MSSKHLIACSMSLIISACMLSRFSRVQLFVTLWMVALQTPLSMGFSRQAYWSGLLCPPLGDLPDRDQTLSPALAGGFFTWESFTTTWEAPLHHYVQLFIDIHHQAGEVPLYSQFADSFYFIFFKHEWVLDFVNFFFCMSVDRIKQFFLYLLIRWLTFFFPNIGPSCIHVFLCIAELNLPKFFLRIFVSMFIREIDLWFSLLKMSLPSFGIRVSAGLIE